MEPPMRTVLLPMKRFVEPSPAEVLPPEEVLPGVCPPPTAFALADAADGAAAVGGAALFVVLAPADGVGEAAVVGDVSLPATLPWESAAGAAAAAFPAW